MHALIPTCTSNFRVLQYIERNVDFRVHVFVRAPFFLFQRVSVSSFHLYLSLYVNQFGVRFKTQKRKKNEPKSIFQCLVSISLEHVCCSIQGIIVIVFAVCCCCAHFVNTFFCVSVAVVVVSFFSLVFGSWFKLQDMDNEKHIDSNELILNKRRSWLALPEHDEWIFKHRT